MSAKSKKPAKCMVHVETWCARTDKQLDHRLINFNNPRDRKWLGTHCAWAYSTGKGVVTRPDVPEVKYP